MLTTKLLTKSELQVMLVLWDLPSTGVFTKQILEQMETPKPAYTTLATFLKILTQKGYITVNKVGSMLFYSPKVTKEEYNEILLRYYMEHLFDGDPAKMVDLVASKFQLDNRKIDEIITILQSRRRY